MKSMLMAIMAVAVAVTFSAPAFAGRGEEETRRRAAKYIVYGDEKKKEERRAAIHRYFGEEKKKDEKRQVIAFSLARLAA